MFDNDFDDGVVMFLNGLMNLTIYLAVLAALFFIAVWCVTTALSLL